MHAHFLNAGGTRTYFFSLIEFLSLHEYEIVVLMESDQYDEEIKTLQHKHPFKVELKNFDFRKTVFTKRLISRQNLSEFIYQVKLLRAFWGYIKKHRCGTLIISEATTELMLFIFPSPVKIFYILHSVPMEHS